MYRVKFKIALMEHEINIITDSMLNNIMCNGMQVNKDFKFTDKKEQAVWIIWPHMVTSIEKQ